MYDAIPGDIYVDEHGKLWRVTWTCAEPSVNAVEVEPPDSYGLSIHKPPPREICSGVGGRIWDGFKRIYRTQT